MKKKLFIGVLVLISISACRKDSATNNENKKMPVSMVRVNEKFVEVSRTKGASAPIVLVGGFGSGFATWQKLYSILPANSTVFTYNRPGIGASENVAGQRDARTIASEMKDVLEKSNINPPYVLVAHSMGGIYARMFYHLYPEKVKGIVLVDATHEQQLDSLLSMIPVTERALVIAQMTDENERELASIPAGSQKEEFRANFSLNYQQIRHYPGISNTPVYVITSIKTSADTPPLVVDIHKALHLQWANIAGENGRFIASIKSGHFIQIDEPELVVEGINWVLSK